MVALYQHEKTKKMGVFQLSASSTPICDTAAHYGIDFCPDVGCMMRSIDQSLRLYQPALFIHTKRFPPTLATHSQSRREETPP